MQLATLCLRSLAHHRRAGIAVALGAAVGTAVLTGALLVGDSMRGSLRDVALSRLGGVDYALRAGRFFRQTLADDFVADQDFQARFGVAVPLIMLRGAATHPTSHATVHRVNVLGVDDRFSALDTSGVPHDAPIAGSRQVILNRPLAEQLGATIGDALSRPSIQVAGGFVSQNDRGAIDQGASDGHALTFTAGKFGRTMVRSVGEPDPFDECLRPRRAIVQVRGCQRREQHVLGDRALRQQVVILEDETDALVPESCQIAGRQGKRILIANR